MYAIGTVQAAREAIGVPNGKLVQKYGVYGQCTAGVRPVGPGNDPRIDVQPRCTTGVARIDGGPRGVQQCTEGVQQVYGRCSR